MGAFTHKLDKKTLHLMPAVADTLEEAKRLLLVKGGWIQTRDLAADSQGLPVKVLSPDACSFCIAGAVIRGAFNKCHESDANTIAGVALEFLLNFDTRYIHWNNDHGRKIEDITAFLDKGIAVAKGAVR